MAFLAYIFPLESKWLEKDKTDDDESPGIKITKEFLTLVTLQTHRHVIIAGPDTADKTSFVFQAAVTAATSGSKVVHICTHPISKLPAPVHGMPSPDPAVMKNVDFLYFEEIDELIAYLAGIHVKKKLPSCIIVEDILSYASQRQDKPVERALAKLLALISNASTWVASHSGSGQCRVLLTAPSRIKSMQNVLRHFDYDLASYEGPSKDNSFSKLSFMCDKAQISVTFHRPKDCLILDKVCVTTTKAAVMKNENPEKG